MPKGVQFFDRSSGRRCLYSQEGESKGWLLWKHPDGQWVTWRKATDDDKARITLAAQSGCEDVVALVDESGER